MNMNIKVDVQIVKLRQKTETHLVKSIVLHPSGNGLTKFAAMWEWARLGSWKDNLVAPHSWLDEIAHINIVYKDPPFGFTSTPGIYLYHLYSGHTE